MSASGRNIVLAIGGVLALVMPAGATPAGGLTHLAGSWTGSAVLAIFVLAYLLVIAEEPLRLPKSQAPMMAAGVIWVLIGVAAAGLGAAAEVEAAINHYLLEFGELFFFLVAAMTYVNTIGERGVFDALRAWLVGRRFTLRSLFWITGLLAFLISPVADNLTTALLMGAVVLAVAPDRPAFVAASCVNLVVAANAGGAFSPFGDITTLMVWQAGKLSFAEFFRLFLPALVNWLLPAALMARTIPREIPAPLESPAVVKRGGWTIVGLFLLTIVMTTCFHQFLHLPPVLGMMTGLGLLKVYGYVLTRWSRRTPHLDEPDDVFAASVARVEPLDTYQQMEKAEWDTLLFFYGIMLCVGGLNTLGHLTVASQVVYGGLGATMANVLVGLASALVDNIPVMFAVLSMDPAMTDGQWLLATLTAGVGGSLLSIGSAAGVALMGQARGVYTFASHLRWTWAVALGFAASVVTHMVVNQRLF